MDVEFDDIRSWNNGVLVEEDSLGSGRMGAVGFAEYNNCLRIGNESGLHRVI